MREIRGEEDDADEDGRGHPERETRTRPPGTERSCRTCRSLTPPPPPPAASLTAAVVAVGGGSWPGRSATALRALQPRSNHSYVGLSGGLGRRGRRWSPHARSPTIPLRLLLLLLPPQARRGFMGDSSSLCRRVAPPRPTSIDCHPLPLLLWFFTGGGAVKIKTLEGGGYSSAYQGHRTAWLMWPHRDHPAY